MMNWSEKKMRRISYIIAILSILIVTYYGLNMYQNSLSSASGGSGSGQTGGSSGYGYTGQPSGGSSGNGQTSGTVKEFTVHGYAYGYYPSTLEVNKGDIVKITFMSDDILHNLYIEGYNVATSTVSNGVSSTIQFTADKAGTFLFYCTVPGHKDAGMTGKLIVDG